MITPQSNTSNTNFQVFISSNYFGWKIAFIAKNVRLISELITGNYSLFYVWNNCFEIPFDFLVHIVQTQLFDFWCLFFFGVRSLLCVSFDLHSNSPRNANEME